VNPRLVVSEGEMAVSGERDDRVGADGVRAVMGFPFEPAAALTGGRSHDKGSERTFRI
jgi:hypothetical protein